MTTFDLRRTKLRPGEQFRTEVPVRLEPFELGGELYRPDPESPTARLAITRTGSGTVFELSFTVRLLGACMRCLGEAVVEAEVEAREYDERAAEAEELRSAYVEDDRLDLGAWARDALSLSVPEQILCRRDCAGLCAGCGANLNEEECRCGPPEPDTRWSKLSELKERLGS